MIEEKTKDGLRVWTPVDKQDEALLRMAEGGKFGETTFPSGWKSPPGLQIASRGKLYEQAPKTKTE